MAAGPAPQSPPHPREREVFLAALDQPSPGERDTFLAHACAGDEALHQAVLRLLTFDRTDSFLESPALGRPGSASAAGTAPGGAPVSSPGPRVGDTVGRYKLLQQIGEGGVGTVFMAEQEEPVRRRVALKVIKAGMDTRSVVARFESERQALALMDHPNIARVLDGGATPEGRPFFVMELVRGTPVTTYCDEHHLPTRARLDLFIKVCQAIQHAHQKGIIHRDIKPSNILVTHHDGVPVPKVIDFGIAKAIDQRLTDKTVFTEFQAFIGTPAYMSPEQAEMSGLDIDTRTDVYSLGVLLYEILTGHTPFDPRELLSAGLDGMRRTIREREPIAPSTRLRGLASLEKTTTATRHQTEPGRLVSVLHGDLDWIVLKALEKDRTRRYETASSLALDVQRFLGNEPITARPPSALYRLRKLAARNRLAVVGMAAFAAALVLGLALAAWQYAEKSDALRRTLAAEEQERRLRENTQRSHARESQLRRQAQEQEIRARRRAYAADINLAQEALAANNLGRARELLDYQRPEKGSPDFRDWEWRHLWLNCRSDALFTLPSQSNEVGSLSISSDGRWLAAGTTAGTLTLLDLRSREEIARFSPGGWIRVAFAPASALLAFGTSDNHPSPPPGPGRNRFEGFRHHIRLWDAASRQPAGELPLTAPCVALAFSADGNRLLAVSNDRQLAEFNLADLTLQRRIELPDLARFSRSVQISPDSSLVAYPIDGGRIRMVEVASGRALWTAQAAEEMVTALAFSPDSRQLATGAGFAESTIRLWDARSGRETDRLDGHRTWVGALVYWPDGNTLASASADQTIRLWDLTPAERHLEGHHERAVLRGHTLEVWSLALAPDRATLVSGSKDGSIMVWDTAAPRGDRGHWTLPTTAAAWRIAPDSGSILTLGTNGVVTRWQGENFQNPTVEFQAEAAGVGFYNFFGGPEFSPTTRYLILRRPPMDRGGTTLWDCTRREPAAGWEAAAAAGFPLGFVSAEDHLILFRPRERRLSEWDLAAGTEVRSWPAPPGPPGPPSFTLSPDTRWCFSSDRPGRGKVTELLTGRSTTVEFGFNQTGRITFSPEGSFFGWVSSLGKGEIWEATTARRTAVITGFLQGLGSLAFSPDGRRAAVGSDGREAVKLWDTAGGHELITLPAEGSGFRSTAFSPDGSLLGSANSAGRLHLWRAPSLETIQRLEETAR